MRWVSASHRPCVALTVSRSEQRTHTCTAGGKAPQTLAEQVPWHVVLERQTSKRTFTNTHTPPTHTRIYTHTYMHTSHTRTMHTHTHVTRTYTHTYLCTHTHNTSTHPPNTHTHAHPKTIHHQQQSTVALPL
eukprot:m.1317106 g.1317106  ORF g.1317106 m.1317106 type:complete len:132 (-) comp24840_c0_seq12:27-422(-)